MEYSTTQNKAYTLVLFIDNTEDNGDKSKKIDIVPTSWLFRDGKDKMYCPFIEDDPDPEEIQLLHQLIKNQMPPKNTWETFEVDIRGDAHTYEEALKKIDKLQLHPYVFTTDDEKHVKERKEEIKNEVRRRGPSQKSNVTELLCQSAAALDKPLQAHETLSILQEKISDQKNPKRAGRQETTENKGETKNSGTRPKSSKPQKSSAQQQSMSSSSSDVSLLSEENPTQAGRQETTKTGAEMKNSGTRSKSSKLQKSSAQ
ncbi:uncharacterized protein [Chelonus insularis]|uniref:uncharacterized protein n=1 Tax=Chelonus insularis TaxID=460826 RepID=UPI0015896395|nr:uncharacterized protein LOC118065268 [Chelonus insularis]